MTAAPDCTCPPGATTEEIELTGGHWPDCPRGAYINTLLAGPHGPACPRPYRGKCRIFSTDGTRLGVDIAHTFGTTDERVIQGLYQLPPVPLDGMDAEQADWEAGDE